MSASYYRHDCLDVNLNNYLRTYLFLISLVVARYLVVLGNILLVAGVICVTRSCVFSMTYCKQISQIDLKTLVAQIKKGHPKVALF